MIKPLLIIAVFNMIISPICIAGTLILGATSTTVNSGLMDYLLPYYTQKTHHKVKLVTGGTGFILQQLERGDVQVAITHQPQLEQALLDRFPAGKRLPFMYNHFILIGPKNDPAHAMTASSLKEALKRIHDSKSLFVSRGDNSGSHVFELKQWDAIGVTANERKRPWYIEAGQDMGPSISMVSALSGYMIADQGTWLAYSNRSDLVLIYKGTKDEVNIYSIIQLKHSTNLPPQVAEFIDWILQADTRARINNFKINGQSAFVAETWHAR